MIVAIHQPHYLPWLRYVHKLASCDVFVLLDDTQYEKNGWQNRNRIKGPHGPVLLTVPVQDASFKPINEIRISDQSLWAEKHWKSILHFYGHAPFFRRYADLFEETFAARWERLADLNQHLLLKLRDAFGIPTEIVTSSSLGVPGQASARLVAICQRLGARGYLTGAYAAGNHLDERLFGAAGVTLIVQAWECPPSRQQFSGQGFMPDLSSVDLLLNHGPDSLEVLTSGQPPARAASMAAEASV